MFWQILLQHLCPFFLILLQINSFFYVGLEKSRGETKHMMSLPTLTPCRREAAIGAVKIVFRPPAFQLLYSANARVNTMKEGLPWLLYIWWLTFVCCQEMKRPNLHENHQLHNGPVWSPGHRNVEAWIELHATEQWAFSPCKAKRALPARPHTEN